MLRPQHLEPTVEDMVQDICLRLLEDGALRARVEAAAHPDRYVTKLSERMTLSELRRRGAQKRGGGAVHVALERVEITSRDSDPESLLTARAISDGLAQRAERLGARGQAVLAGLLRGESAPDLAREMNVSVQVVYNWTFRIRREGRGLLVA